MNIFLCAEKMIEYIEKRDKDDLNNLANDLVNDPNRRGIPARMVIEKLKNRPDDLEFFFSWFSKWCSYSPGAGSYHYTNIEDNRTFDIYKKYGFSACNLSKSCVSETQWDYLLEIGYITRKEYESGFA